MAKKTILGTEFADVLTGGAEGEIFEALAGDDLIVAGDGNDKVSGGDGNDVLVGEKGHDLLIGDRGNDIMLGGYGNDTMVWNNGDGSDIMEGGEGWDKAVINGSDDAGDEFEIASDDGRVAFERVNFGQFSVDIGSTEKLVVNGQGGWDTIDASGLDAGLIKLFAYGGAGNDTLLGSQGDDYLDGGWGNDLLVGNRGNDVMKGGAGNDTMVWNNGDGSDVMDGGTNWDKAVVNGADTAGDAFEVSSNGDDVFFERTNLGPFTIDIKNTEKLEVNGQGGDDTIDASGLEAGQIKLAAYGGAGDDVLLGSQGDDYLDGGWGNDLLVGNRGNDVMKGGAGNDTMVWNNGDGSDVMDGGTNWDKAVVNGADGAGDAFEISSNGDDVFFERTNLGPFTLDIQNTEKLVVNGQGGDDTIDATWLDAGQIKLFAYGGGGNDTLIGSEGDDYLDGGWGNDTMTGNEGADTFVFAKGHDTITDFESGVDEIVLKGVANSWDYGQVEAAASQQGDDVVIDFGNGNSLTLEDTMLGHLNQDDFVF